MTFETIGQPFVIRPAGVEWTVEEYDADNDAYRVQVRRPTGRVAMEEVPGGVVRKYVGSAALTEGENTR